MSIPRRKFLSQAAACGTLAVAAGAVSSLRGDLLFPAAIAAEPASTDLPIVDCHQHLWDLEKFKVPWLTPGGKLGRSFVMADYKVASEGLNIVKAVYMEVDVAPEQQVQEAEYLIEICQSGKYPTCAAVISGRPGSDQFEKYIRRFEKQPLIKGVRQVLHAATAGKAMCLEEQFVKSIRLLGTLGKSFDLCMRASELSHGAKLAELCPDTRFILDHCGNGDVQAFLPKERRTSEPGHDVETWKKDIAHLASLKNVICKISGLIARVPEKWSVEDLAPVINHCLDSFGPDRVIFGSDWPVCLMGATYKEWVVSLKQVIASRPLAEQKKLLHDNAVKFYGI